MHTNDRDTDANTSHRVQSPPAAARTRLADFEAALFRAGRCARICTHPRTSRRSDAPEAAAARRLLLAPEHQVRPASLASNPDKYLPVIIRARIPRRAETLLRMLRAAPQRPARRGRGRISDHLRVCLDWLAGSPDQNWLYLAQWRAHEEVPELHDVVKPLPLLAPLLEKVKVDLCQSVFFVGPVGAVSGWSPSLRSP
ncbi:hypothetical protein LXA43DRAFT_11961 [Ganoderma leucocontextum]|nr:hypothetical protein LXA43DRAFT_11961 [Ganoderma leucocontextum]